MDSYLLGRVGDHQNLVVSENWWFAGCPGEAIQDHRKPLTTTRTKTTLVPDDNPSFWGPRFSSRSHKIFKVSNFHFFSFIVLVSVFPTGLPFEFYLDSKTKNKSRGFFTVCKITERLFGSTDSAVLRVGALRSSSRDTQLALRRAVQRTANDHFVEQRLLYTQLQILWFWGERIMLTSFVTKRMSAAMTEMN